VIDLQRRQLLSINVRSTKTALTVPHVIHTDIYIYINIYDALYTNENTTLDNYHFTNAASDCARCDAAKQYNTKPTASRTVCPYS